MLLGAPLFLDLRNGLENRGCLQRPDCHAERPNGKPKLSFKSSILPFGLAKHLLLFVKRPFAEIILRNEELRVTVAIGTAPFPLNSVTPIFYSSLGT
jgi:hypothetical protein